MRMTYAACLCTHMLPTMALGGRDVWPLQAGVLGWAVTVAASRVVYGRHHLLDVLAGAAVGVLTYRLHLGGFWVEPELAAEWQTYLAVPVLSGVVG